MKLLTGQYKERVFCGCVYNDSYVVDLELAEKAILKTETIELDMVSNIEKGNSFLEKVARIIEEIQGANEVYMLPIEDVQLLAPITRPRKNIFCVGKNYRDHAIEMGSAADIPKHVMLFSKAPTTVIGPNETVLHHNGVTSQLDYEGELAVIIGKKGVGISEEDAMDYVFGYTVLNDITARDLQDRHKQFLLGKSLDTSCPMGPWIVTKKEIPDPHHLQLQTKVNGELRQNGHTSQFIFNIPHIISVISRGMTLEPGDIIATGTPAGVGKGFKPPRFLQPGDVMEITIEGIGSLINKIQN
ncbi:FAA hydrolase family protein [Bacillus sp. HMF5848]|uniref:fumarylacetoacetate hydrolase family protein n=1 Tax=Bacillus sp. HMF5848 TaxID=2495421 RepID=UPI000F7A1832|nr:fumarylacetoacetate hydrolase family protein [Bacillus sp. HMF5848]RSK26381.1 FAA hydrolase family protein [Bacillus sp. HMF5848]